MPSSTTNEKRTVVRGLGEIALRVNDLAAMQQFYEQVIGLPLMTRFPNSTLKCSPCSTAPRVRIIEGRTLQLPPSTTSHSRYLLTILQTNGRNWRR